MGLSTAAAQPQRVKTGFYLMNLYDLNMDEHSFYADFYVWFKWKGPIDPTNVEFVNAVEKWGMTQTAFADSVAVLHDSTNYKILRIEGRFFHSFAMEQFPLDRHGIDIQMENPDFPAEKLIYEPDTGGMHIRESLNLVGWNYKGCKLTTKTHDYGTDFGNPEEKASKYSNITYEIALARPLSYFALKMMLPLAIVLLVSLGALLLHPSYIDTRSSLPIGGLLTAVFLQQTYNSALPDSGSMVLMDKIYLLCYVIISLVMLQVILSGNTLLSADIHADQRIQKKERQMAVIFFLLFWLGVAFICL